jgi:hypothetical protein
MRRTAATLTTTLLWLALLAPVALAEDHGEGLYGPTDDKVVTNAGFIVIAFFPLLVFTLSMVQWRLDKRKEARMAAKKARASRDRGGW